MSKIFTLLAFIILVGCQSTPNKRNLTGEHLYRKSQEVSFSPPHSQTCDLPAYPWENKYMGAHRRITKDFFRCQGTPLHEVAILKRTNRENLYFRDCEGHGLPLRDGKEFIYPCLIELLNYLQVQTDKRVVITSGHCCPKHSSYCDPSPYNWSSKHMIGAEVDFYVEGFEEQPELIIEHIQNYYKEHSTFCNQKNYTTFERFSPDKLNVATSAWFNKEIFIKLYLPHEGRDIDNQHLHPYLSVQVRYDRDQKEQVRFDSNEAQNYLRN